MNSDELLNELTKKITSELKQMLPEKKETASNEKYKEFFLKGFFEETFTFVSIETEKIESDIEKSIYIKEFFRYIEENFKHVIELNKVSLFGKSLVNNLSKNYVYFNAEKNLEDYLDKNLLSFIFANLVSDGYFEHAKFVLKFINKNLETYNKTLDKIINNKNEDALCFLLDNLENIKYKESDLIKKILINFNEKIIFKIIEKYDFTLTNLHIGLNNLCFELFKENKNSLILELIKKYPEKIDISTWNTKSPNEINIISYLMDNLDKYEKFVEELVSLKKIPSHISMSIFNTLFENDKLFINLEQHNILENILTCGNIPIQDFILEEQPYLYGVLTKLLLDSNKVSLKNEEKWLKIYQKCVDVYIKHYPDNEPYPLAVKYHILGASVFILSNMNMVNMLRLNLLKSLLKKFYHLLNDKNPNGMSNYQVAEGDELLRKFLIQEGYILDIKQKNSTNSWVSKLTFGKFGKKKLEEQHKTFINPQKQQQESFYEINNLKKNLRKEVRVMLTLIENELLDDEIRVKCQNLFVYAENLLMKMDKHQQNHLYEDLHFISHNFTKYLKKNLNVYLSLASAIIDFTKDEVVEKKLNFIKKECLGQIILLEEQLKLIETNVFTHLENEALKEFTIRRKVIQDKIEDSSKKIIHVTDTEISSEVESIMAQEEKKLEDEYNKGISKKDSQSKEDNTYDDILNHINTSTDSEKKET